MVHKNRGAMLITTMKVILMLTVMPALVSAQEHQRKLRALANVDAKIFRVALWGDLPYEGQEVDAFDPTSKWGPFYKALSDTINDANVTFSLHTGDVKGGSTPCGELNYKRFEDVVNSFNHPALVTLGDNCWTDCHRLAAGNYDPLERLAHLRSRFYDKDGFTVFGDGYLKVSIFDQAYPEIHYWNHGGVTFINAHVVGSNNALYDGVDGQCNAYLAIIDPDCKKATAEFTARDDVSNAAISYGFNLAKKRGDAGVAVLIQANIFGGSCNGSKQGCTSDWPINVETGFRRFWENLKDETAAFGKPVVLIFGDSHEYQRLDNPGKESPHLMTVMVPGSSDVGWVLMTVDPKSSDVFSFKHVDNTP